MILVLYQCDKYFTNSHRYLNCFYPKGQPQSSTGNAFTLDPRFAGSIPVVDIFLRRKNPKHKPSGGIWSFGFWGWDAANQVHVLLRNLLSLKLICIEWDCNRILNMRKKYFVPFRKLCFIILQYWFRHTLTKNSAEGLWKNVVKSQYWYIPEKMQIKLYKNINESVIRKRDEVT